MTNWRQVILKVLDSAPGLSPEQVAAGNDVIMHIIQTEIIEKLIEEIPTTERYADYTHSNTRLKHQLRAKWLGKESNE